MLRVFRLLFLFADAAEDDGCEDAKEDDFEDFADAEDDDVCNDAKEDGFEFFEDAEVDDVDVCEDCED